VCLITSKIASGQYNLIVNIRIDNPQGVVSLGPKALGKTTPIRLTILDVYIH
jgi:hypothetical protein